MIDISIEKKMRGYRGHSILKIETTIAPLSIIKAYGESGAGKTTFLKILAGLIYPEQGKIEVYGTTWLDTSKKFSLAPQKRQCGFVFQDYALFPNMNVQQHLEYASSDGQWIDRLLKFGLLDTLRAHRPQYLSGGQQQRLAILRALAIKPKLLLMDEPFSALDHQMRTQLISDLKTLIDEIACTSIIVSHNPHELDGIATGELVVG